MMHVFQKGPQMSSERQAFITYLLRPRETVCFVDPRPPLMSEAKSRATTAVEEQWRNATARGPPSIGHFWPPFVPLKIG